VQCMKVGEVALFRAAQSHTYRGKVPIYATECPHLVCSLRVELVQIVPKQVGPTALQDPAFVKRKSQGKGEESERIDWWKHEDSRPSRARHMQRRNLCDTGTRTSLVSTLGITPFAAVRSGTRVSPSANCHPFLLGKARQRRHCYRVCSSGLPPADRM